MLMCVLSRDQSALIPYPTEQASGTRSALLPLSPRDDIAINGVSLICLCLFCYTSLCCAADAAAMLSLLASLAPLLHSTSLAHVTPQLSSACPTVESLTAALRDLAQSPAYEHMQLYPKLQQSTAERLAAALHAPQPSSS